MKLFVVFTNYLCDDPYYGYNESLDSVYDTFENAQAKANTIIQESPDLYSCVDGYVTIFEMTLGDSKRTKLFCNITPRPKKKVKIEN